jgi:hypothetical protein
LSHDLRRRLIRQRPVAIGSSYLVALQSGTLHRRPILDHTFQWLSGINPEQPPEPPRQIEYRKPELPADLTEADWSIMLEVLELVKRTVPTNDERPPAEIFAVMKAALMEHFRDHPEKT